MQFVLFDDYKPGLLLGDALIDLAPHLPENANRGQAAMLAIITRFAALRPAFEAARSRAERTPLDSVRLRAPLPRPNLILAMGGHFMEGLSGQPLPFRGFIKGSESVLDPDGLVELPEEDYRTFAHEAELVVVIGRRGYRIPESEAMEHVFGYTCGMDVSARLRNPPADQYTDRPAVKRSPQKSHRTFSPLGPAIVTNDDISDPYALRVRMWVDGQIRHDYPMSDMGHSIAACIANFSNHTPLNPGDIIFLGCNHQGVGPLQDGEHAVMTIDGVGSLAISVRDPLKRTWPKAVEARSGQAARKRVSEHQLDAH